MKIFLISADFGVSVILKAFIFHNKICRHSISVESLKIFVPPKGSPPGPWRRSSGNDSLVPSMKQTSRGTHHRLTDSDKNDDDCFYYFQRYFSTLD